jgi:hypothetical protein
LTNGPQLLAIFIAQSDYIGRKGKEDILDPIIIFLLRPNIPPQLLPFVPTKHCREFEIEGNH